MRASTLPALTLALLVAGCGESPKPEAAAAFDTRFDLRVGKQPIRARVALTELELATGLMTTPKLSAEEGMVFAYRKASRLNFWMKDVPYDIDIAFFDTSGRLDEVVLLKANDLEAVPTTSDNIRYALEAPAGWFAKHGLVPGAKLDLDRLASAIRSRGFESKAFIGE